MVADAVHSFSDLATDVVVIVFARISAKPRDDGHDYGHGKYETSATILISMALGVVGVGILVNSIGAVRSVLDGGVSAPARAGRPRGGSPFDRGQGDSLPLYRARRARHRQPQRRGQRLAPPQRRASRRSARSSASAAPISWAASWRHRRPRSAALDRGAAHPASVACAPDPHGGGRAARKVAAPQSTERAASCRRSRRSIPPSAAPHNLRTRRIGAELSPSRCISASTAR